MLFSIGFFFIKRYNIIKKENFFKKWNVFFLEFVVTVFVFGIRDGIFLMVFVDIR